MPLIRRRSTSTCVVGWTLLLLLLVSSACLKIHQQAVTNRCGDGSFRRSRSDGIGAWDHVGRVAWQSRRCYYRSAWLMCAGFDALKTDLQTTHPPAGPSTFPPSLLRPRGLRNAAGPAVVLDRSPLWTHTHTQTTATAPYGRQISLAKSITQCRWHAQCYFSPIAVRLDLLYRRWSVKSRSPNFIYNFIQIFADFQNLFTGIVGSNSSIALEVFL